MMRVERQADEAGRYREAPHLLDIASFHSMRIWSDFLIVQCLMNLLPSLSHFDKLFPHKSKLHKHKDLPPPNKNNKNWILLYIPSVWLFFSFSYTHIFFYLSYSQLQHMTFFFFLPPLFQVDVIYIKRSMTLQKYKYFQSKSVPFVLSRGEYKSVQSPQLD